MQPEERPDSVTIWFSSQSMRARRARSNSFLNILSSLSFLYSSSLSPRLRSIPASVGKRFSSRLASKYSSMPCRSSAARCVLVLCT